MEHILRFFINEECAERQVRELIDYCRETDCRKLLLFTTNYDREPSFLPLDMYRRRAENMHGWMSTFKTEGIVCGINMMQTLGHVYYPEDVQRTFGFRQRMEANGGESGAGACPLDEVLIRYIREVYKIFAALDPSVLYVDDDFRYWMQGPSCFCNEHMRKLSDAAGEMIDRESLVNALTHPSHPKHSQLRALYQSVQEEALTSLASEIRRGVDEIAPQCPIGLMTMGIPKGWWGTNYEAICEALAGPNHPRIIRPQMAMYNEIRLSELPAVARQCALVRQTLKPGAVVHPEIECYMYGTWSKSATFTRMQMLVPHLDGMHKLAINQFDYNGTPLTFYEEFTRMNMQNAALFSALEAAIPEGNRSCGVVLPITQDSVVRHAPRGEIVPIEALCGSNRPMELLIRLGLPVGFDWETSPFVVLAGSAIDAFDDNTLREYLSRGAIIDQAAFEALLRRGLTDTIPAAFYEPLPIDDSGVEVFPGEAGTVSHYRPVRAAVWEDGWAHRLAATEDAVESFTPSSLQNWRGEVITPMMLCVENRAGIRFGLLAFSLEDAPDVLMLSAPRKRQMEAMLEWIARAPLPVSCGNKAYLTPIYQPVSSDTAVIGLLNASTDDYDSISPRFGRGEPKTLERLEADGCWSAARRTEAVNSRDVLILRAHW